MSARALLLLASSTFTLSGADISLPHRPADAPGGSTFARQITDLKQPEREQAILRQIELGNVPDFWRRFAEVRVTRQIGDEQFICVLRVSPDYLAIGSDEDYLPTPVSPAAAQAIADRLGCILPTRRVVDEIHRAALVKLIPSPIPPSAAMTTVPVFQTHNETIRQQRSSFLGQHPLGTLVSGHKKDVVLTPKLAAAPGKVAIYGWHKADGQPIQPLYLGHSTNWVDYSHGARFIHREVRLNGTNTTLEKMLADPKLNALLSDEGPLQQTRYAGATADSSAKAGTQSTTNRFGEQWATLSLEPGVRVVINSPPKLNPQKLVRLVLYALPNGNTIEHTIGRKTAPGDDWHFNIQHIGAQTRWLREHTHDASLVVAYLECTGLSWPAWRRNHDPDGKRIAGIVERLRQHHEGRPLKLVLTGHSGGGSFTLGYLNGVENIPGDIERIAFLDSNYAYDAAQGHAGKLARWLADSKERHLCVIAYHDSVALLNGKTFVSASGGTWGRSHAMRSDLEKHFAFVHTRTDEWQRSTALDGQLKFLLKENPTKAVFHTRLVELNGFIHALLTGTELEDKGYVFFGERAYERWIEGAP